MNRDEIIQFLVEYQKSHEVRNQYFSEELEIQDILDTLKGSIPWENPSFLDWFFSYIMVLFPPIAITVYILLVIGHFILDGFSSVPLMVWMKQTLANVPVPFSVFLFLLYPCLSMFLSLVLNTIAAIPLAFSASKKANKKNKEIFDAYEEAFRSLSVLERQLEEAKRNKNKTTDNYK